MTQRLHRASEDDHMGETAAQWTVRRDRGLSAAESIEFELWLAADPRHRAAMKRAGGAWARLDRTPESVSVRELARLARRRAYWRRGYAFGSLGIAAAVVISTVVLWRESERTQIATTAASALVAAGPREVTLADGTLVRLNAGGEVVEEFEPAERRVRLTRGEAHFTVVKNSARPFVVVAGTLRVRAVGTAFNVNFDSARVEVLVTEGQVRLAMDEKLVESEPLVGAGERAVVSTDTADRAGKGSAIVVSRIDPAEMSRRLAWQDSLVRLGGATLAELVAEFEQRFGQRVVIADSEIAHLRAGGRIRADEAEDFANLLAATFDLEVERAADGARVLRKKKSSSR